MFEPSAEVIRNGKASKPTEFGKLLKLQEAENQIVIDYEVFAQRPSDMDLLIPAIDVHQAKLGRTPRLVAADAGFYSAKNEAAAKAKGVKRVCIPNRSSKSAARKREQKKRWFRNGQRWRTGCEGRISVSKRRHGLNRCRYRGDDGMQRWVGLGVIAATSSMSASPSSNSQPNSYCPSTPRWCTKPWESTVASSGLASSWHAEVSGTRRDGWRHCRPVGRVAPSFHASIWEAHAIQVQ